MRAMAAFGVIFALGVSVGGCASSADRATADPWVGGDAAHMAADETSCRSEAANIDPNQAAGYSDPRYGMTSAMAAAVAKDNPLSDTRPQQRQAAFAACMSDKGWHQP